MIAGLITDLGALASCESIWGEDYKGAEDSDYEYKRGASGLGAYVSTPYLSNKEWWGLHRGDWNLVLQV